MTIKDRDEMKRSHSASRKACDDDYSEYTQSSYTQDKGKGRLRSEDDSKVVGEQENRNLCIRHKNMADEGTSAELQEALDQLPLNQRSAVTSIWSSFSAASGPLRVLILKGILQTCCFSQLSYLYEELGNLIRIDPFVLLPREINLKIMGYLDAISLARAAQVSRSWKNLADDDLLWRNMCEQHIERKCEKCGWGLPLLEKRRKQQKEPNTKVGSAKRALLASHTAHLAMHDNPSVNSNNSQPMEIDEDRPIKRQRSARTSPVNSPQPSRPVSPTNSLRQKASTMSVSSSKPLTRPWKAVYTERLLIERNWRRGTHTVQTLSGHTEGVMCLQFDENAHPVPTLITGSYDRTARVWNLDTGEELGVLRGHTRGIRTLKFDEAKLITGSMDRTLKIWNWRTGECIRTLEGHREGVVCLDFDKTVLASGSADATVKVWKFKTAECFTLRGHRDWVNSVQIWDGQTSTSSCTGPSTPEIEQLRESQKILFSASDDGCIKMWSLGTKECLRNFDSHVGQVQDIKMILVDSKTLQVAQNQEEDGSKPKFQRVLDTNESGSLQLFRNASNMNDDASIQSPSVNKVDKILSESTSEAVPMLVSGALDNTVKLWDVNNGTCARTLFGHIEGIWSIDADRLRIVSTSHDRTVKVWDTDTGKCLATLVGHAGAVTAVQLSGDKIVTAGDDRDIRIYSFAAPE
ncbi:WD40 repeat-like protein [Wallemia mellicola]|nr:WD40 repeat-like protein [Wallemia mellicola]